MLEETPEQNRPLRTGLTTGACATACSVAAAKLILNRSNTSQTPITSVSITLPRGEHVEFTLESCIRLNSNQARASTIKDAGDDPDATHGATIISDIQLSDTTGVRFHAGEGVGTVTRDGLSIAVGEAAINPVPRKMMTEHLLDLAENTNYKGGFDVTISVENGAAIALNTMNGRLGILGGISILGTTGIVRPYSCAAFIASIHQSIDVAHANGVNHIAAATGSTSESYIQDKLALSDMAIVEMGDFAGAVLKHLRKVPMKKLSICGGFGKMSKMAAGNHSLHSKDSSIDFEFLADQVMQLGGNTELVEQVMSSNTSLEALAHCQKANIALADRICALSKQTALDVCQNKCEIDVYAVLKDGSFAGSSIANHS